MTAFPMPDTLEAALRSTETPQPDVSVVVLVTGRPEPLQELYEEFSAALSACGASTEFVFVVEPGFNDMVARLRSDAGARAAGIRIVSVGTSAGYTGLLRAGVPHCRGGIVLSLPARRRVQSGTLAKLVETVKNGADMAVASRGMSRDSWFSAVRSRVFHALVARVVRAPGSIADVTSGVRASRRELLENLPLYGDSATLLPLLALREGYSVVEVPAARHANDRSSGVKSPFVYLRSLFDLLSLFFLLRFTEKPLRFFGLVGSAALVPGALILGMVLLQRLGGRPAADRPLLLFSVLFIVLGIQMIALGLVGEIIVHLHRGQGRMYRLRDRPRNPVDGA